jgi:alcohol dehydrogenase
VLTGDVAKDSDAMRAAAGGAADLAFDMIGRAADPNATLAALRSLRRQGRLVLMGSMNVPLPLPYGDVMFNDWEIIGQFMYPPDAYRRLLGLVATGQLDLRAIRPHTFTFDEMPAALDAAAAASSVECVVVLLG